MAEWFSIEVLNGAFSAASWVESRGDAVIAAAHTFGVLDYELHSEPWGVVLELEFDSESTWDRFRAAPPVTAALDAVPDPVNGLLMYRGRGGSSGTRQPAPRRPLAGAGAVALPIPDSRPEDELTQAPLTVTI